MRGRSSGIVVENVGRGDKLAGDVIDGFRFEALLLRRPWCFGVVCIKVLGWVWIGHGSSFESDELSVSGGCSLQAPMPHFLFL